MAKVLLVEDDNNLREIFEMRLQAEGYQTVTAGNGEEGLTVAMQEKPDLIIADVMMPKLSGFDMLESLRAAPEMKNTKVVMMTALGQAEDQARGEKLGVVKYLVKSQATLEDFARVIKEVMPPAGAAAATIATPASDQLNSNQQESEKKMPDDQAPAVPTNDMPAPASDPMAAPAAPATDATAPAAPASDPMAAPAAPATDANPVSTDMSAPAMGAQTTADEQAQVQDQMNSFASSTPAAAPASDPMAAPAAPATDATDADAPVAPSTDGTTPPAPGEQTAPTI